MEELSRQTQSFVDAYIEFDSGFFSGPTGARGVGVSSSPQRVARHVWVRVWENVGCVSGDGFAVGSEVHAQRVDGAEENKADKDRDRSRGGEVKVGGGSAVSPPTV